jgi:hypothetical protein
MLHLDPPTVRQLDYARPREWPYRLTPPAMAAAHKRMDPVERAWLAIRRRRYDKRRRAEARAIEAMRLLKKALKRAARAARSAARRAMEGR